VPTHLTRQHRPAGEELDEQTSGRADVVHRSPRLGGGEVLLQFGDGTFQVLGRFDLARLQIHSRPPDSRDVVVLLDDSPAVIAVLLEVHDERRPRVLDQRAGDAFLVIVVVVVDVVEAFARHDRDGPGVLPRPTVVLRQDLLAF